MLWSEIAIDGAWFDTLFTEKFLQKKYGKPTLAITQLPTVWGVYGHGSNGSATVSTYRSEMGELDTDKHIERVVT